MADVSVTYKGSTIGSLSDTGQLTLETAGTYCEGDIDITYVSPGGGGGGVIYQDANGYLVLDDEGGNYDIQPLSVTSNGTYTAPSHTAYTPVTVNVSGGGSAEADAVRFIDYDGTILYYYSAADFLALSAMPANPSHTGLTAQGWNWTLSDAQDFVDEWGYLDIGQLYVTTSGATEIDIELPTGCARLDPYLNIAVDGTVEVNWGDNTTPDTITGNSLSQSIKTQHIYNNTGNYTISISVISGSFSFYHTSSSHLLTGSTTTGNYNKCYANYINAIRMGNNAYWSNYTCYYCTSLKYITVPSSFSINGQAQFQNCYSLKTIIIPSVTGSTNAGSYNGDYSLKYLSLPKGSNYSINGSNFISNCFALNRVILPTMGGVDSGYLGNSSSINTYPTHIIKPTNNYKSINSYKYDISSTLEGMTSIPNEFFGGLRELYSATIPNTVTSIGNYAFANCIKLTNITLPSAITSMPSYCFSNCFSLESITIPTSVTSIGQSAFSYCQALSEITIPSNVETFGSNIFSNCRSLKKITINSTKITSFDANSFSSCEALKAITIPNTVTSLGNSCFYNCYSLTSITIPNGVTSIGTSAFGNCYGMKEYHFQRTTPPSITSTNVFSGIPSDCIIYVPYSADHSVLNAYKTASYWSTYASQMQEEPQ